MSAVILQIVISIASVIGGLFALIRYVLRHLEKKNGMIERLTNSAFASMREMSDRQLEMQEKSNEVLTRLRETIIEKL